MPPVLITALQWLADRWSSLPEKVQAGVIVVLLFVAAVASFIVILRGVVRIFQWIFRPAARRLAQETRHETEIGPTRIRQRTDRHPIPLSIRLRIKETPTEKWCELDIDGPPDEVREMARELRPADAALDWGVADIADIADRRRRLPPGLRPQRVLEG